MPRPLSVCHARNTQYLERHVPLHERMAFYAVSDVAVVTATRDGMNLVPYEYILCRQGPHQ
jgi:trehalose 6-phosphate synthase/phosphatase